MFLRNVASLLVDVAHVDDDLQRRSLVEKHHQLQIKRCGRCYLHRLGRGAHTGLHFRLLENELHRVRTQSIINRADNHCVRVARLLREVPLQTVLGVNANQAQLTINLSPNDYSVLLRDQLTMEQTRSEVLGLFRNLIVGQPSVVTCHSILHRTISIARRIRRNALSAVEGIIPTYEKRTITSYRVSTPG